MTKPSWRALIDAKIIKRTDNGMAVRPDAIRIIEGFNVRDTSDPEYRPALDALKSHIKRGGKVPALEVVLSADGLGVDVIEGHRRTAVYRELIAEGDPIQWIRIEPFEGNDVQRTARILTSQDNLKLKPLEIAEGYRRLEGFGLSHDDIARIVGKTRTHVAQMLVLLNAPHAVHEAVKAGEISATDATKLARAEGDNAGKALDGLREQAAAQGKKKITAAVTRQWTPPAKAIVPVVEALDWLHSSLKPETRMQLLNKPEEHTTVEVPAAVVFELLNQHGGIDQLRAKAAEKIAAKAAKAAQASIPGADGA